ncbi:MAG: hypothetical protein H6617_02650 [Bdellovibrionaceae bacterium]|nr:hypothetical protein [Pseudobdellovibrionaceae bacterium]
MAELEPLNENDTGSFNPSPPKPKAKKPPGVAWLKFKRYFWWGCRVLCDLCYGLFGFLSLCGGYLFFRQLYDYFAEGAWSNGSLHAVLGHWVPQEYLKGWFPAGPGGETATLYWILDKTPAAVFLVVVGVGVLLFLTSLRWQFVVWEQQAMVKITSIRGK